MKAFIVSIGGYGNKVLPVLAKDPQRAGELYAKRIDVTASMSARVYYDLRVIDEDGDEYTIKVLANHG